MLRPAVAATKGAKAGRTCGLYIEGRRLSLKGDRIGQRCPDRGKAVNDARVSRLFRANRLGECACQRPRTIWAGGRPEGPAATFAGPISPSEGHGGAGMFPREQ